MQLQGWKQIERKIVGPAGFNANPNTIPHGTGQADLIHHQLQLEHLLILSSSLSNQIQLQKQLQQCHYLVIHSLLVFGAV